MKSNFEQLIPALQISSPCNDVLSKITCALEKQNSELLPSFISELFQSILTLERWTWKLLGEDSHQWIEEPNYLEFFRTLADFNKNLIFNYDSIDAETKASLLIPDTTNGIVRIFDQVKKSNDDNDPFMSIVSLWIDNLSYYLQDNPKFENFPIFSYINRHIARNYIMTDQYKFYLSQLRQLPLSQSIFTAKQLFYIKTCSLSVGTYLFANAQSFPYTPEEIFRHIDDDYVQILVLHTYTIESWSEQLLTCVTGLIVFMSSCCWWGGERGSQGKILVPTELIACQLVDALIRIIAYKPFYQYIQTQQSNDQTTLLNTTLFAMLNIAQRQDFAWFLRSKASLPEVLLNIAEVSDCDQICLCVYSVLGEILSDECLKELKISNSASAFLFDTLEQAWRNASKKCKHVPLSFILRSFVALSKIDAIQQQTAETNKVSLLVEMCDHDPLVFDSLWALSFNHDIQQQLRSNSSFMSKLAHLSKEFDSEQMRKITHGILWNLESNHQDRAVSEKDDGTMFDIMISYSHNDKIFCKQLYEELIKAGYRIWIDFDQMHGNVMDAMAQAIERSKMVIICMSEQYRRSNYCRAEAHYAFQRQLKIVPVILQQHYKPDGWLLFLVGQLLYIDFTKYEFPRAMEMLLKELKVSVISELVIAPVLVREDTEVNVPTTPISSKSSPLPMLPENILDWTQTNVQDWLINHDLLLMSRLFANFDGRSLVYMNEFIKNVEIKQIVTLLQEDSLRRTNQSLSLVELMHFRSLMDQQQPHRTSKNVTKSTRTKIDIFKRKYFSYCRIMR